MRSSICHTGDAGWISGQALNGFIAASLHGAPIVFVMHRNGIQLSGTTARDHGQGSAADRREPRHRGPRDRRRCTIARSCSAPTRRPFALARGGKPSLIYPVGVSANADRRATSASATASSTRPSSSRRSTRCALDTPVWIPGSLMSFRDPHAMLECLFYVNELPGGEAHHDGGMKGRDQPRCSPTRCCS